MLVILADQATKAWIRSVLDVGDVLFDAGVFRIIHVTNTGAAFGIFKGYTGALAIASSLGIVVILILVLFLRKRWSFFDTMPVRIGIGLILGGTIGNLIDRIRLGNVTDFFDVKVWPTFNVADASAVVGSIILAICIIFMVGKEVRDKQ